MDYTPPNEILEKYARVLVNFALGGGAGIKSGQVVYVQSPLSALPFYRAVRKAIIDSGGVMIHSLTDDMSGAGRYFYENASQKQLTTFLDKYFRGLVDQIDHRIAILADHDPHELDGVDPKKIMLTGKSAKPLKEWLSEKEKKGLYSWTLALYGTPAMAKEAGLSLKEYWAQIIDACYLDRADSIAEWHKISTEIKSVTQKLTRLQIDKVHVKGEDVDLQVKIGEKRRWVGGSGQNIPSFEVFTSPDWRGTEGWIRFNMPLYRYGSVVKGIELTFEKGRVVKATAKQNEKLLKEMLKTDTGSSQVGEFSLTDRRLSRITKFMAETLYDENVGGKYGNTHIAVGSSFADTFDGDVKKVAKKDLRAMGFNDSSIHTDMFSTTDRTVTATLKNGKTRVIYKNGQFTV